MDARTTLLLIYWVAILQAWEWRYDRTQTYDLGSSRHQARTRRRRTARYAMT